MEKIINGEKYYIPGNLTSEQRKIYCHIIDWKRKNITAKRGVYRGHEYDAIFPVEIFIPLMLYEPLTGHFKEMQNGEFAYKPHNYANHAVSSQTACINLFMPILLSDKVNDILAKIPGCPSDFKEIVRDRLFHGFCFEYWGQDIKNGKGLLNDHSKQAGTDADVAIAYHNVNGDLCLWLIEHKLSEKEFTKCGGYSSEKNEHKENCKNCNLASIVENPQLCHYQIIGYKYWELMKRHIDKYNKNVDIEGCPFIGGLNQLWRNQMLGFALREKGDYKTVIFSVCHHEKNTMLNKSMDLYSKIINDSSMFSHFTNYDILDAVDSNCSELQPWSE